MELKATFSPGRTTLELENNGVKSTKEISLADLVAEINTSESIDLGLLPPGTRDVIVARPNVIVAVELPAGKREMTAIKSNGHQAKINDVAMPAALFVFVLRKAGSIYQMLATYVFALENDRIIMTRDKLFHFPTPNVYTGDKHHQICWGPDNKYDLKSPAGIEGMIRTFLTAPFNTDLFGTDKMSTQFPWDKIDSYLNIDQYFKFLSGETEFKSSWLKPASKSYETFETALKTIADTYK